MSANRPQIAPRWGTGYSLIVAGGLVLIAIAVFGDVNEAAGIAGLGVALVAVAAFSFSGAKRAHERDAKAEAERQAAEARSVSLIERARAEAEARLVAEFGDPQIVALVREGRPWIGATPRMIEAALGAPQKRSESVAREQRKASWTYDDGVADRVVVRFEGGAVVGWEIATDDE
jgi:hypothetical protein